MKNACLGPEEQASLEKFLSDKFGTVIRLKEVIREGRKDSYPIYECQLPRAAAGCFAWAFSEVFLEVEPAERGSEGRCASVNLSYQLSKEAGLGHNGVALGIVSVGDIWMTRDQYFQIRDGIAKSLEKK